MTENYGIELAGVYRNSRLESRHLGHVCICNTQGDILWAKGDPEKLIFGRSVYKPFQALPFVASGLVEKFGFEQADIALSCASHNSEREHLERVRSILSRIGASEADLRCGGHRPVYLEYTGDYSGLPEKFTSIFNNCSGKHAAMLGYCKAHELPLENYLDLEHPLQIEIRKKTSELLETELTIHAFDGCSAPTYGLTIQQYAHLFALLAQPATTPFASALETIRDAMVAKPFWVSGYGRADLSIMQGCQETVVSKVGAEGIQALGLLPSGLGIIIKFEDGSHRAREAVSLSLLKSLGMLKQESKEKLRPAIKNCNGIVTGEIRPNESLWKSIPKSLVH